MRLIRGMSLANRLKRQEIIGSTTPQEIDILSLIWMIVYRGSRWILTTISTKQPPEGGEKEDEGSNDECDSDLYLPRPLS